MKHPIFNMCGCYESVTFLDKIHEHSNSETTVWQYNLKSCLTLYYMAMDVVVVSDRCLRPTPLRYIDPLDLYLNTSYILRKSVVKAYQTLPRGKRIVFGPQLIIYYKCNEPATSLTKNLYLLEMLLHWTPCPSIPQQTLLSLC